MTDLIKNMCKTGLADRLIRFGSLSMLLVCLTATAGCASESDKDTGPAETVSTAVKDQDAPVQTGDTDDGSEADAKADDQDGTQTDSTDTQQEEKMDYAEKFKGIKLTRSYKGVQNNNPIIEQHYGADPFAMVYDDTVYIYMTADAYEYGADKEIAENTYGKIKSIYVVSTKDMINFTDHGEIMVAGENGAAKWAHNSWAPAAAWKEIDGKPKFFLYFADNVGGIGVVTADSPVGPFRDELGHGLIRRDMENCGNVEWLFDPAVLVDDDGRAYIYFGGGVPKGRNDHPMTARCAELGDDMMSLKDVPLTIDAPYLFEDSGIHKFGGKYYYSYCSNFSVDEKGTEEYGFENGEIIVMESENPLGPFTFKERILKNPGFYWGAGGNNHHAVFKFKDRWYITYHTRMLEKEQGILKGYRSTSIEEFDMGEDGTIGDIRMTKDARKQIGELDPYEEINAATFAVMAGVDTAPADETSRQYGCGTMLLTAIDDGDYVKLQGAAFGDGGASSVRALVRTGGNEGVIRVTTGTVNGEVLGYIPVKPDGNDTTVCEAMLDVSPKGTEDVFFTFSGSGYEVLSWKFGR